MPTQARSRERLERILEAADRVFADAGLDGATMEAIAERAGTSIGSVYQFFPNKGAVFEALCQSYLERSRALFEELLTDGALARPWPELLDAVIDAFWRFHVALPGFRAVWVHQSISAQMLAASDVVNRAIAARTEEVFAHFAPGLRPARRGAVAAVVVEAVSALLFSAARRDEPEASRMIDETKAMLRAYLAVVLAETT